MSYTYAYIVAPMNIEYFPVAAQELLLYTKLFRRKATHVQQASCHCTPVFALRKSQ